MRQPEVVMYPELTARRLAETIGGAREIYVSGCSAEIIALPDLLDEAGIDATVTGIFSPILNRQSYAAPAIGRRSRSFFLNEAIRRDIVSGNVDFCPWTYGQIASWIAAPGRFDAAVVMVSPPDFYGRCSLGTQADFLPGFYDRVGRLIGVVNPAMPQTAGASIAVESFAAVFACEQPLLELKAAEGRADPESDVIAARVADMVPDGATLQIGIGRLPQAVTSALASHRRLKVRSGMIDDSILQLEAQGALDPDTPIVTGVAIGSRELYAHVARNARFDFRPVTYTHDRETIAATPHFFAINGALEVDLFGQINSEAVNGRIVASPGGLPDFMRGARQSAGGASVVAVRAKPGRAGRGGIVAQVQSPCLVSLQRCDIDFVVTENGVADLRTASLDARAEALIAIADPGQRAALGDAWRAIRAMAFA